MTSLNYRIIKREWTFLPKHSPVHAILIRPGHQCETRAMIYPDLLQQIDSRGTLCINLNCQNEVHRGVGTFGAFSRRQDHNIQAFAFCDECSKKSARELREILIEYLRGLGLLKPRSSAKMIETPVKIC